MTTLDLIAVIALASAILFLLFTVLLVVLRVRLGRQLTKLKRVRTKNKKKRKRLMRQRRGVEKKRRKYLIWALLLFVLAGAGAGTSAYTIYYQSTNLNRYYSSLKDLGINLASRNSGFYTNAEELADFKEDLAKVRSNQKEVFKTFSVNEASLKEQK